MFPNLFCFAKKRLSFLLALAVTIASFTSLVGCSSGGGSAPTQPTGTITDPTGTITDPTKAATINYSPTAGKTLSFSFPANTLSQAASVFINAIGENSLPLPITRMAKTRAFTPNSNNVYIEAFKISFGPTGSITKFNVPVTLSATGIVPTTIPANTVVNIAYLQSAGQASASYVDVGTFLTGPNGTLIQNLPTTALPGLLQPGTYVLYEPAAGSSTSTANYGIALLADDLGEVQVINLYDSTGHPLAQPSLKSLQFPGASDLDGQALTPDGSYGILVDGGNTVRFFSGVQTGVPIASTTTVDVSAYGGDGDAVAILPNGDTAVVTGDSNTLLVVSGIVSGNPQPTTTILCPDARDGLVISSDGKTLLARGPSGLTVFAITPTGPTAGPGPLGGTLSYTFTQVSDLPVLAASNSEDGRDGMAISPADPSRAVVIGLDSSSNPTITLLSGLPNAPVTRTAQLKVVRRGAILRLPDEDSPKHPHTRLALNGVTSPFSVAVTPDGKSAIVGTDSGLVLVSGVDTGTLAQIGTTFNPTYTVSGSTPQTFNLGSVTTLAVTLDGRYVVACSSYPSSSTGSLLMYPITSTGFGAQVSQLDNINIPFNDQILLH